MNRELSEAQRNAARSRIADIAGRLLAEAWLRAKGSGEPNCSGEGARPKLNCIDPPDDGFQRDDLHKQGD